MFISKITPDLNYFVLLFGVVYLINKFSGKFRNFPNDVSMHFKSI